MTTVQATPTNRLADKIKLRKAYVRGEGSLAVLAALHGVPYGTANVWSNDEKWTKLKAEHDEKELAKLRGPTEEQQRDSKPSTDTEQQLALVNEALNSCDDSRDWERLTRAKLSLMEAMHIERHGAKPGTLRPSQKQSKRSAPSPEPISPVEETPAQDNPLG